MCRSGLAYNGIFVHNETIESDYRENVCVIFFNFSNEEYTIEADNCIGQLIIERCFTPKFVENHEFSKEKTERGQNDFGYTGL